MDTILPQPDQKSSAEFPDDEKPVTLNVAEFLHVLYADVPAGWLEITYIAPKELRDKISPGIFTQWRPLPLGNIDPALPNVRHYNQRGYGVYFGVAVRGEKKPDHSYSRGSEKDSSYLTALWLDIDHVKDVNDERYQKALNLDPLANIVIKSGGGVHFYWALHQPVKITEENLPRIKHTLRGLAIATGSDTKVAELARVMRLPTTINTKPENNGAVCEVIDYMIGKYHYDQIEATYARLGAPKQLKVLRDIPVEASAGLPEWVTRYLGEGAAVGKRNQILFGAAVEYKANGLSQQKAVSELGGRARADGLSQEEIERTIQSAYDFDGGKPNIGDENTRNKMAIRDNQRKRRKF